MTESKIKRLFPVGCYVRTKDTANLLVTGYIETVPFGWMLVVEAVISPHQCRLEDDDEATPPGAGEE